MSASVTLLIPTIVCASCVASIEKGLSSVPGVSKVAASPASKKAQIHFDPLIVSIKDIIEEIDDLGHDAQELSRTGVERKGGNNSPQTNDSLSIDVSLNPIKSLDSGSDTVELLDDDDIDSFAEINRSVEIQLKAKNQQLSLLRKQTFWCGALVSPLIVIQMILMRFHQPTIDYFSQLILGNISLIQILSFVLTAPIQFYFGKKFYISAWKSFKRKTANMDTLVVISTSVAYFYSFLVLILEVSIADYHGHTFFETAGLLISVIFLGKYFEHLAKEKTSQALLTLPSLRATSAILVQKDGSETEISIEKVRPGMVLKVRAGDVVPTDGTLLSGSPYIDESMITGEPVPVLKEIGQLVIGATISSGVFTMKADRTGKDTTLAKIIQMVEDAQMTKPPIQKVADTISSVFVPIVIVISIVTFVIWYSLCLTGVVPQEWILINGVHDSFLFSLNFAISVLVIACPCTLGLATPTAVMVGTTMGLRRGILIRNGSALEVCHKLNTICFDKTGTITLGKPQVVEFHFEKWVDIPTIVSATGAVETNSTHPLAKCLFDFALEKLKITEQELQTRASVIVSEPLESPGMGIQCLINQQQFLLGNSKLLEKNGITIPAHIQLNLDKLVREAATIIYVASCPSLYPPVPNQPQPLGALVFCGYFALKDPIRPDSHLVIHALQKMKINCFMVTGDNKNTAKAVAQSVGIPIENLFAELLPGEKLDVVKQLQKSPKNVVAFVGDGINDAPALNQSHCGISVAHGSDVAIESADIVLLQNNLVDIYIALDLAQKTFDRIRLNFFWSMIYNIAGIPLAAGAFFPLFQVALNPVYAGLAMGMSSVSVVVSSLQLFRYKSPKLVVSLEELNEMEEENTTFSSSTEDPETDIILTRIE